MSSNSIKRFALTYCKGRSALIKLIVNFIIVLSLCLFVISQLYKNSKFSSKDEKTREPHRENDQIETHQKYRSIVLPYILDEQFIYNEPPDSFFKQKHNVLQKHIDWHNYTHIDMEKKRNGPGEGGKAFKLTSFEDIQRNNQLNKVNGYWAVASDLISPNRSVLDIRHKLCWKKKYLTELPTASVIIPFFNDHLSVLMRTVHSVINRAPRKLLKEVILVNDKSTKTELYGELEKYLAGNFEGRAHVIHLEERSGLITARLAGARVATGDVLIFLDSHTEANINYLPPLLDPIAMDYRTCVCPFIDVIDAHNFEYRAQDEGARGAFEWNFLYKRLEIRKEDRDGPADNFPSPVMAGGLFAISAKFFWELGGYDEGLDIWGGEQYELSFKIWLCGGKMLDTPCSRIGHIYKHNPFPDPRGGKDYLSRNFKRVAEVWMDEYKEYLYQRKPDRYKKVDVGDISKQLGVKEKLQCKPFKYFLEVVAPDMLEKYPPVQIEFASGSIESVAFENRCIDSLGSFYKNMGLYYCSTKRTRPSGNQHFYLGYHKDIEFYSDSAYCVQNYGGTIQLHACTHQQDNQYFRYDLDTKQLKVGTDEVYCLEADDSAKINVKSCNSQEVKQKWKFGRIDEGNIKKWNSLGAKIKG